MENKLGRFFRTTGKLRFFLPLAVILIVMGVLMIKMSPDKYEETTGVVTEVNEYTELDSDNKEVTYYEEKFTYTVNGKEYNNSFDGLAEKPAVGDVIKVYYDPDAPEFVSNTKNTRTIGYIMIGVGIAALLFAVLSTVKAVKKNRELDEKIKTAAGTDSMPVVTPLPKEQLTEYYVSYDGVTLKPGYIVEDKFRNVIFAAPMTKNAAVGNRIFTFKDMKTGRTTDHEVGHTFTQSYNDEFFSTTSSVKFDGVNIWDLLHDRGIRIATDLHSIFPRVTYTVSRNGRFFATVETSGKYVHEEDAAMHKVNVPVGRYYYRCWTNENDIELLFLTVFAISETEQAVVE